MDIVRRDVKYARIEIRADGSIRVVAPEHVDIDSLISQKRHWIDRKRREIEDMIKESKGKEDMLLLNGRFLTMNTESDNEDSAPSASPADLRKLGRAMRQMLKEEMERKVRLFSLILGVKHGQLFIRAQKTKWASCSPKGNLSFNIRMAALPERLKEYIVIHELAHLLEPNHSKRFWRIVERQYPDYQKAEWELKKYWLILERNNVWGRIQTSQPSCP